MAKKKIYFNRTTRNLTATKPSSKTTFDDFKNFFIEVFGENQVFMMSGNGDFSADIDYDGMTAKQKADLKALVENIT